ncbi:MAG TPA: HAMP domain-containing sensor histidine kinase [Thermomicrobiales bacterium]|nr:HAMP domain-containing sensor histidine kinase [Thermomicrobiales bacterium]
MSDQSAPNRIPWRTVTLAIVLLLIALASAGVFGVIESIRLQHAAERTITYNLAVAGVGDDIRVDILDLRFGHRNIVFGGPTDALIADFDEAYTALLADIDRFDALGVANLAVPQPTELRTLAQSYHDAFRPSIVLFTSDPIAFNTASAAGLTHIEQLEGMAVQINQSGQQLTTQSLTSIEQTARRQRRLLISLLTGVALISLIFAALASRLLTRFQQAHAAEQRANLQLAETSRMRADFIADASHELRTPLTVIRGNAEIGTKSGEAALHQQMFAEILAESKRMTRLINDLLFIARTDAEVPDLETEYLPAAILMRRFVAPAEALARTSEINLTSEITGSGHLVADMERIQQAVLILVDNAVRFSPVGGTVALIGRTTDTHVEIAVSDQGPGIPPDMQERIFARYYQVPGSDRRKRGGAGLGLAIAHTIVTAHNGTISVVSAPEQGTTMTIRLPLAPIPE